MYTKFLKRIFDILFSLAIIIAISPLWIIIIFVLLISGEHRVFYKQKRVGHNCETFTIWKHASMIKNSEKMTGGLYTTRNDPRILPIGRFIRRTKLDEIPQLFHILSGKMSFVGPRPLVINNPYPEDLQKKIYKIKPGVTGIGSIIFRNEERLLSETKLTPEEFYANFILPYKASLELWYQENQSFHTDAKLIFCTVFALIIPDTNLPFLVFQSIPPVPGELNLYFA